MTEKNLHGSHGLLPLLLPIQQRWMENRIGALGCNEGAGFCDECICKVGQKQVFGVFKLMHMIYRAKRWKVEIKQK